MNRLPEPEATEHHGRLVDALLRELRHYGVQSLAGILATLLENDRRPDAQLWAIKFRKMEDAPGPFLLADGTSKALKHKPTFQHYYLLINTGTEVSVLKDLGRHDETKKNEDAVDAVVEAAIIEAYKHGVDVENDTFHLLTVGDDGTPVIDDFSGGYMEDLRVKAGVQ